MQILLSAPLHIARKGECEGETFAGFPTRVQSSARRRPLLHSKSAAPKKKDTHVGVFLFWSGRRGSTRYRHPTNGRAIRRSPAGPLDLMRFAPVEAASSSLSAAFQKENTILTDGVSFCDCPQVLLSGDQLLLPCFLTDISFKPCASGTLFLLNTSNSTRLKFELHCTFLTSQEM